MSGAKWEYAARSAFMTILASFGGGLYALAHSITKHKGKVDPSDLINGILGSLVGITGNFALPQIEIRFSLPFFFVVIKLQFNFPAGCFLFRAWESILVGLIGAIFTLFALPLLDKMRIDDPVGMLSRIYLWLLKKS